MVSAPPEKVQVVLLTDAVEVACPRSRLVERLCADGGSGLLQMADSATGEGEGVVVRVGPTVGGHVLGVPVRVLLGPSGTRQGACAIPIRWEAAGFESLFPVFDGTLLVDALSQDRCRLGIEGSYRVPFDRVGQLLDRVALHLVAEATVRSFLERLGTALAGAD